jgi:hypothetical protein
MFVVGFNISFMRKKVKLKQCDFASPYFLDEAVLFLGVVTPIFWYHAQPEMVFNISNPITQFDLNVYYFK